MKHADTHALKERLEQELATLELELVDVGYLHPAKSSEAWAERQADLSEDTEDRNILADKFEENTTNDSIARELVVRHNSIKEALGRIEAGTYGLCVTCNKPISQGRLDANPAASTCIEHAA